MPDRARCESLRRSCSSVASQRVYGFLNVGRVSTGDYDFFRSAFSVGRQPATRETGLEEIGHDFLEVSGPLVAGP
jgi:hypothetical protein